MSRTTTLPGRAADVGTAVALAGLLGRAVQRGITDVAAGARRPIPRRASDLDAPTMSRLLGRRVTAVSLLGGDAGTSERARLALSGDDVPATVFVKLPAETAATRVMGELGRLGHTEVSFYRQLSDELDGVPKHYGSQFDSWTGRYVLVLEDLPSAECEFPDTLHPIEADRAELIVELLARLHGTFWGRLPHRAGQGALGWLYSASADSAALLTGPLLRTSARRLAERTSIPVWDGRFIVENYRAVARLIDAGPQTVTHGDAHPGNVYFRNGAAGLLDWQAVRRAHPSRELAYTLVTGMTTAERQASERQLLETYRRALAAAGGPDLDPDELWTRYRQAALYAYVAALITAGMGGMQDDGIALEGLRRAVAALGDLDTVAELRKAL